MNFEVIVLGLVQGLTEFLPVSSSGHLALAKIFLGAELPPLNYDLVLHVSTTLATVIFFARDIAGSFVEWLKGFRDKEYRQKSGWNVGWAVIVGTLTTGVIGFPLKNFAEAASLNAALVGAGLIVTGTALLLSRKIERGAGRTAVTDGIWTGLAQGLAVMPGVSRSGMTIIAGLAAGLSKEEAFRFSFLLSVPAIVGAASLQALETGGFENFVSTLPPAWFAGALCAFVSGLASLAVLKKLVITSRWSLFGVYCLFVGAFAVAAAYMGG